MSDIDVLSARLEVNDSFTSKLNNFIKVTENADKTFEKFINNADRNSRILEKTLDVIEKKVNSMTTIITAQTDVITNKIINSTNKIEQTQNKITNNITSRYTKMGKDISNVFKDIGKDAEVLAKTTVSVNTNEKPINNKNNKSSSHNKHNSYLGNVDFAMNSLLGGDFSMMLMNLGIIGAGIIGMKKVLDTINGWAQQGYNALNTLSTGLFSVGGIQKGLEDASGFESARVAMDALYGNESEGQQYYSMGIKAAQKSMFKESDVVALQKKLAGGHINYTDNPDALKAMLGMASLKPQLGAEKVGFSILDAMYGRTTSLKTNYMIDNKEVQAYLKSLQKTDPINAKKWKNAFNTKGAVDNKQEYFDLLINYVKNNTHYAKLTDEISQTLQGRMSTLQGNWEILKADLLGIDQVTGKVRDGSAFYYFKEGVNDLINWLNSSNVKQMLSSFGQGLGEASRSILDAFQYLLKNIDWKQLGDIIKKIGESIAKIVKDLTANPAFMKLLDQLPDLIERILNSKAIEVITEGKQAKDIANGKPISAGVDGAYGWWVKSANNAGALSPSEATKIMTTSSDNDSSFSSNLSNNASQLGMQMHNAISWMMPITRDKAYLTDANASTYLEQNSNLSSDQKSQIKDMISNDSQTIYHITVGEVKTDSAEDLIKQLQSLQSNQK